MGHLASLLYYQRTSTTKGKYGYFSFLPRVFGRFLLFSYLYTISRVNGTLQRINMGGVQLGCEAHESSFCIMWLQACKILFQIKQMISGYHCQLRSTTRSLRTEVFCPLLPIIFAVSAPPVSNPFSCPARIIAPSIAYSLILVELFPPCSVILTLFELLQSHTQQSHHCTYHCINLARLLQQATNVIRWCKFCTLQYSTKADL